MTGLRGTSRPGTAHAEWRDRTIASWAAGTGESRGCPVSTPCHLMCGKVADRSDRLFGVVRRMWRDDHVVQAEERVHRLPVPLLGRFLLDVVQAGAGGASCLPMRASMMASIQARKSSRTQTPTSFQIAASASVVIRLECCLAAVRSAGGVS